MSEEVKVESNPNLYGPHGMISVYLAIPIDGAPASILGKTYRAMKEIVERDHPTHKIEIRNGEIYEFLEEKYYGKEVPGYLNKYGVYSPFEIIGDCIKEINAVDIVYFHPDWAASRGCQLEHEACELYCKPMCELRDEDLWAAMGIDDLLEELGDSYE